MTGHERSNQPWRGSDRRRGPDRRQAEVRREEIRFEPGKADRRNGKDRRMNGRWGDIAIR